jgi:hypothetical protein
MFPALHLPDFMAKLQQALHDQGCRHGAPLVEENRANLRHAFRVIRPATFTEAALVVWAGSQLEDVSGLVHEYCRRRGGQPPQLFDHPVLTLADWCQPETRGILVFQEQLQALSKELTSLDLTRDIYRGDDGTGCSPGHFASFLRPRYRETLTGGEIMELHRYIREMAGIAREFAWCAGIVERAVKG